MLFIPEPLDSLLELKFEDLRGEQPDPDYVAFF